MKNGVLRHIRLVNPLIQPVAFSRFESATPARIEEHGFESTRIADILKGKGKGADGSWLWCTTDDSVYDAVKSVRIFELDENLFNCNDLISFGMEDLCYDS